MELVAAVELGGHLTPLGGGLPGVPVKLFALRAACVLRSQARRKVGALTPASAGRGSSISGRRGDSR